MKFIVFYFQMTALHIAICKGNTEIVKILLMQPDIDVNKKGFISIQFDLNCV